MSLWHKRADVCSIFISSGPQSACETPGQWRQSEVLGVVLLLLRQDEGPVEVDGAGRGRGVLYHGGAELQPERLPGEKYHCTLLNENFL